jgi:hypothetical protein
MGKDTPIDRPSTPQPGPPRVPLPAGYRQAIVTAITVLLGFSLLFLRYWNFELPGAWSASAIVASLLLAVAIILDIGALWRSLQVKDDDEVEYGKTLRWFLFSTILLLLSLLTSAAAYNHLFNL